MTVKLVSYRLGKRRPYSSEDLLDYSARIINEKDGMDLILFSGFSLPSIDHVGLLQEKIHNRRVTAVLESDGWLAVLQNGKLRALATPQIFAMSSRINSENARQLLSTVEFERCIEVAGKTCAILLCGEVNILRYQRTEGVVDFRYHDDEFKHLFSNIDVILNPIHYPMGEQGVLSKKREFLTRLNGTAYFSSCSNRPKPGNDRTEPYPMDSASLQYAAGSTVRALGDPEYGEHDNYVIRRFEIE